MSAPDPIPELQLLVDKAIAEGWVPISEADDKRAKDLSEALLVIEGWDGVGTHRVAANEALWVTCCAHLDWGRVTDVEIRAALTLLDRGFLMDSTSDPALRIALLRDELRKRTRDLKKRPFVPFREVQIQLRLDRFDGVRA